MKPIQILTNSDVPIYKQIREQVRTAILKGELQTGEQLPSARQLATNLGINMLTVHKAWNELRQEGLIESRRGEGMFVLPQTREFSEEQKLQSLKTKGQEFLVLANSYGLSSSEALDILRELLDSGELS